MQREAQNNTDIFFQPGLCGFWIKRIESYVLFLFCSLGKFRVRQAQVKWPFSHLLESQCKGYGQRNFEYYALSLIKIIFSQFRSWCSSTIHFRTPPLFFVRITHCLDYPVPWCQIPSEYWLLPAVYLGRIGIQSSMWLNEKLSGASRTLTRGWFTMA